jgi:hypothetical protein
VSGEAEGEGGGEVGVLSCGGLGGGEGVVAYEERHQHHEEGGSEKAEAKATGVEMVAAKVVVRAAAKVASTATETETAREEVAREVGPR